MVRSSYEATPKQFRGSFEAVLSLKRLHSGNLAPRFWSSQFQHSAAKLHQQPHSDYFSLVNIAFNEPLKRPICVITSNFQLKRKWARRISAGEIEFIRDNHSTYGAVFSEHPFVNTPREHFSRAFLVSIRHELDSIGT